MSDVYPTIVEELGLSDEAFREMYLEKNIKWWENFIGFHERGYGGVICADCEVKIPSPEQLRPLGGKNYCVPCFRDVALKDMKHFFSLDHPPVPYKLLEFAWEMRVGRVMDGSLTKRAETDIIAA